MSDNSNNASDAFDVWREDMPLYMWADLGFGISSSGITLHFGDCVLPLVDRYDIDHLKSLIAAGEGAFIIDDSQVIVTETDFPKHGIDITTEGAVFGDNTLILNQRQRKLLPYALEKAWARHVTFPNLPPADK